MEANGKSTMSLSRTQQLVFFWCVLTVPTCWAERPNIVLVMSDDMGFSDIGCYGGEIETPTLDRLADGGLRFTQFYNTGRCCPTRASLLTGLYPHQAGIGWMMSDRGFDGYRGDLNRQCVTIAEALKPGGYATYAVGKWHIAKDVQPQGPQHNWPLQRGFDRFYGTITGAGSFFDPATLTRDNTAISALADPAYQPEEYYYTDAISDHAVQFIDEHVADASAQPFFMYVAYTAAHWPMHAKEQDISKYHGRYDQGYEPVRKARFERARKMGLVSETVRLSEQVGDWETCQHPHWEARCMEVYAAMVDSMDQGIGRIVTALEKHEKLDNTLILFLQDNGGCQETNGRRGEFTRPVAASLPEIPHDALLTAVVPRQNRRGVPTLTGPGILPGPEDTYIAYGMNWANVSNTPFREYKHFVHEGGISTPLIAHWPLGIKRARELEQQPGHLVDIMATCLDIANVKYPTRRDEQAIKPLQGVSLAPAFHGEKLSRANPLFWEHEGNRAIRDGNWKLVAKENRDWELYDMRLDRSETKNLAQQKPAKVAELSEKWDAYAKRANVLPLGAWRGKQQPLNYNKEQKVFSLNSGTNLARDKAPFVEAKGFSIQIKFTKFGTQGVLVAQGGTAHGYSLFVQNQKLCFAARYAGKLSVFTSEESVEDLHTVGVELAQNGKLTLRANGNAVGQSVFPGGLKQMPVDGLQVGSDKNGAVGPYQSPFPFDGTIAECVITVKDR